MKLFAEGEIMILKIREKLRDCSEEKYRKFMKKLIPEEDKILGVRMKDLRKIAKELLKEDNFEEYVLSKEVIYNEEVMLQGLLIGKIRGEIDVIERTIEQFIPRIRNWCICDSFCSELKIAKNHKKEMWIFLKSYYLSKKEYEIRFALVMTLKYFIEEEYLDEIFFYVDNIQSEEYYACMGIAWLLAEIFAKFPERVFMYMNNNKMNVFTYSKTIQKICESSKVSCKKKEEIKKYKRV